MSEQARWYGVSYGNGNDGVSQLFPNFYVFTAEPYRLASLAIVAQYKREWKAAALETMIVDGEEDYTISATILDPLDAQDDRESDLESLRQDVEDAYKELEAAQESEDADEIVAAERAVCDAEQALEDVESDESTWHDSNGAYAIVEVFPIDESDMRDGPKYDSLDDAFDAEDLALVASEAE
jgi:hypothetical protein